MAKRQTSKPRRKQLYIVHGWAYSLTLWQPALAALAARDIDVKVLKVPGLTKPSRKVWSMDDYVAWLNKELAGVRRPTVLGHSNGGRILLNYCLRHGDKIGHMILLNSAGMPPTRRQRLRYAVLRLASKLAGPLKKIGWLRALVYRCLGVSDYNRAPTNMKATLRNMIDSDADLAPRLRSVKTPVSLIWGENDKQTPLAAGIFLHSRLPNVTGFRVLENTGHTPYSTHPQMLTQAVLDIL